MTCDEFDSLRSSCGLALPPLPRRHRLTVDPQPAPGCPRLQLCTRVLFTPIPWLLLGGPLEVPRHPGLDLGQANISAGDQHPADLAPEAIDLGAFGHCVAVEHHVGQTPL